MPALLEQPHLTRDEHGVLRRGGVKDIMFVTLHVRTRMAAAAPYPSLTLGQIHAGLSYYYDHKAELERREREAEESFCQHPPPPERHAKTLAKKAELERQSRDG